MAHTDITRPQRRERIQFTRVIAFPPAFIPIQSNGRRRSAAIQKTTVKQTIIKFDRHAVFSMMEIQCGIGERKKQASKDESRQFHREEWFLHLCALYASVPTVCEQGSITCSMIGTFYFIDITMHVRRGRLSFGGVYFLYFLAMQTCEMDERMISLFSALILNWFLWTGMFVFIELVSLGGETQWKHRRKSGQRKPRCEKECLRELYSMEWGINALPND